MGHPIKLTQKVLCPSLLLSKVACQCGEGVDTWLPRAGQPHTSARLQGHAWLAALSPFSACFLPHPPPQQHPPLCPRRTQMRRSSQVSVAEEEFLKSRKEPEDCSFPGVMEVAAQSFLFMNKLGKTRTEQDCATLLTATREVLDQLGPKAPQFINARFDIQQLNNTKLYRDTNYTVNPSPPCSRTLLQLAVCTGNLNFVQMLLDAGLLLPLVFFSLMNHRLRTFSFYIHTCS